MLTIKIDLHCALLRPGDKKIFFMWFENSTSTQFLSSPYPSSSPYIQNPFFMHYRLKSFEYNVRFFPLVKSNNFYVQLENFSSPELQDKISNSKYLMLLQWVTGIGFYATFFWGKIKIPKYLYTVSAKIMTFALQWV